MVNPVHLMRFAAVAQGLSFSDAARTLGIDQATLSRQVRQLETELGLDLFRRTTRKVELTAQGEALLPAAAELSRAFEDAQRRIDVVASEKHALLRFGMHPFVYWSLEVRAMLAAFGGRRRDAKVETISGMSERQLSRLQSRALDAALILQGSNDGRFETIPVMQVRPHLVLPSEHPAAEAELLSPGELKRLRVAVFHPGRDRRDFERVYGPFFEAGADPVPVSEGAAAVVFHATADRLAMISLRPPDTPAPHSFVRRTVKDAHLVEFALARLSSDDRSTTNHFWNCAVEALGASAKAP